MNCLLCIIALSAVGNSSRPSLQSFWTVAATQSSWSEVSSFTPRASFSEIETFDFAHSVGVLIQRESARGRGKWSGWMATDWLRLRVALIGGSNAGAEIGATAILFQSWLSPTITTEAGHSSGGDAFSRVRVLTKSPYLDPALIRGFSYNYEAAYVGLELGAQRFAISVNLGLIRAENAYQSIQSTEAGASNPVPGIQCARNAQIGPAGKLALLLRM
jgi:hypothetical protein